MFDMFAKWTTAKRDALPLEDFGQPEGRLFPIADQSDIDGAAHLIGKAKNPEAVKRRIIAIAKRKNLQIPDAWQTDAKMAATFAVEPTGRRVEGAYAVYPNSLLFQGGEYADKAFAMTPEEMWAAVEQFQPVGGNIEHTDFLRGRACEVRSIRLDAGDSNTLRGEVAVPLWLDEHLEGHERRLSCEWDRATKTLAGIGLVVNPRVPEAALMAAFAAAEGNTPMETTAAYAALFAAMKGAKSFEGQMVLQDIHDLAARHGAVHKSGQANYHTAPELDALQTLHDTAAAAGATCPMDLADSNAPNLLMPGMARYSANKENPVDKSLWDQIKAYFSAAGVQVPDEPPTTPVAPPAAAAPLAAPAAPADAALLSRNQALESEVARMRAERITEKATEFAEARITEGSAFPAERQAIIAQYTQAALDDNHLGVVTFADGSKGNRVDLLVQQFAARPKHTLDIERVPANLAALVNLAQTPDPKKQGTDPDTIRELIALTPGGQAHLSTRNGSSN